ncbi:MAG: toprim domain-containing protein, partial [Bacilli bacterium]
ISKICKYLKDIADIRLSVDTKRIKLTDKYSKSKLTNLPAKFVGPTGDPNVVKTECFIVEGDSAGGHMKNHRNNITQGYFPIRGKIPNAFKTSKDKFLGNAEVAGIITIIGGGYGKDFDITKVKWDKIIIGTDADADGAHIAVLLERFFILYMPGLIESGKLYKAVPPLYSIGGKKRIYIHNKTTYIKYVQDAFIKNNTVADISGTPLNPKQLSAYFYRNSDYTYEMKKLCDLYAVDPTLLEIVLTSSLNGDKFSVLKKKIKKEVRFLDSIEQHGNTISVMGLYKSKYQTIFINQSMLNDCKRVMDILASNDAYVYKLNGNLSTIYEIMLEFDKSSPSSLQRYKGLGEMDGYELFDSTMNPDNRILIQYRIDDLKEELDAIRYYESNNLSDLMVGVKVTRSDLLS